MIGWFAKQSLGLKFALMVIAILVATMSVVTYLNIRSQHQMLVSSLTAKGQALGDFVSLISPQSILSYDFESMNDFMREVSKDKDIIYAVLVAENGIDLTQFVDDDNNYVLDAKSKTGAKDVLEVITEINKNAEIIKLSFPVKSRNQSLGKLIVGMSRRQVDENYQQVLIEMLLANALIIVFLSVCIYIGFRYMAIRPIANLRKGLSQVANGDLHSTIEVRANDEIGALTLSFNYMVNRLEQTIAEKDEVAHKYKVHARKAEILNDVLQARVEESARIMRDLHDDVGAKLLTLVHRSDTEKNAEMARAALKNLRETIRGLGKNETAIELIDALADWEAEATDRLDAAGIKLHWDQPDDFPEKMLTNRQLINLSRILRETISNAIRHANPSNINVKTDINDNNLKILICDDGEDYDSTEWEAGTGLNNMLRRSRELNGSIKWYSAQSAEASISGGACVEINCPLEVS